MAEQAETASGTLTLAPERGGTAWLAAGLAAFGFAVGMTAGLSKAEGTATTLLSALFSFVGGVLLTFGGFVVRGRDGGEVSVSGRRLGSALLGFSLGIVLGTNAGIFMRVAGGAALLAHHGGGDVSIAAKGDVPRGEGGTAPEGASNPTWALEARHLDLCKAAERNAAQYNAGEEGQKLAIRDALTLRKALCEPPPPPAAR